MWGREMSSRREFLRELAGTTAGVFFVGCGLIEAAAASLQSGSGMRREIRVGGRRIKAVDVHCHCYIHDVWDLIKDHEQARPLRTLLDTQQGQNLNLANVQDRLSKMDQQGIDIQAISLGTTYLYPWADQDLSRQIMKIQNEKIAELCAAHPDRFVGMAGVSLQHPDLAAEQLEQAVKNLGMRGCIITGSVNGEELSVPKFHPFWAKAEELGCLVFIHPSGFDEGERRFQGNGNLGNVIGNPLETTVALSHLIFEGTLDRFPRLKICAAHGGGFLASYSGRSDHCVKHSSSTCKPIGKLPSEYLKQLYYDSLVYTAQGLRHLVTEVGASQILLGSDFPYAMGNTEAVNHILNTTGLSDADREAILGKNAAGLLRIDL